MIVADTPTASQPEIVVFDNGRSVQVWRTDPRSPDGKQGLDAFGFREPLTTDEMNELGTWLAAKWDAKWEPIA